MLICNIFKSLNYYLAYQSKSNLLFCHLVQFQLTQFRTILARFCDFGVNAGMLYWLCSNKCRNRIYNTILRDGVVTFWLYEHVHSGGHFLAAASTSMYHRRYHEWKNIARLTQISTEQVLARHYMRSLLAQRWPRCSASRFLPPPFGRKPMRSWRTSIIRSF